MISLRTFKIIVTYMLNPTCIMQCYECSYLVGRKFRSLHELLMFSIYCHTKSTIFWDTHFDIFLNNVKKSIAMSTTEWPKICPRNEKLLHFTTVQSVAYTCMSLMKWFWFPITVKLIPIDPCCMNKWMKEWLKEWMHEWMNECKHAFYDECIHLKLGAWYSNFELQQYAL